MERQGDHTIRAEDDENIAFEIKNKLVKNPNSSMKVNQQLLQINRNFLICFIVSASVSAVVAQLLADYENHLNTTITIIVGQAVFEARGS